LDTKHLKIKRDLEEEFRGKENELHSEYYYNLFFEHFFTPWLKKRYPTAKNLKIMAYSWWEVCNGCERFLTNHQNFLPQEVVLSYQIAATRPYHHAYPKNSVVRQFRVPSTYEKKAWRGIWGNVTKYVAEDFKSPKDKKRFWTRTKDGLELCKW